MVGGKRERGMGGRGSYFLIGDGAIIEDIRDERKEEETDEQKNGKYILFIF